MYGEIATIHRKKMPRIIRRVQGALLKGRRHANFRHYPHYSYLTDSVTKKTIHVYHILCFEGIFISF